MSLIRMADEAINIKFIEYDYTYTSDLEEIACDGFANQNHEMNSC